MREKIISSHGASISIPPKWGGSANGGAPTALMAAPPPLPRPHFGCFARAKDASRLHLISKALGIMLESGSSGFQGEGNTSLPGTAPPKRVSPAKHWCFTLNNPTEAVMFHLRASLDYRAQEGIIGLERGASGTEHLQGWVTFQNKLRPLSLGDWAALAHWEKCKGSKDQNIAYCSKDGNVVWRKGVAAPPKIIDELNAWQSQLVDAVAGEPDDRSVIWCKGGFGCGKTAISKYLCIKHGACLLGGARRHILSQAYKVDAPIYIFNIPAGGSPPKWETVEALKDGLFCAAFGTEANGMVVRNSPHIIIFSNEAWDDYDMWGKETFDQSRIVAIDC